MALETRSPYKGLSSFQEDDAEIFFGREVDRDAVVANIIASPLTIVYGPTGVGKSSLLNAGVIPDLRRLASEDEAYLGHPAFLVRIFREWQAPDPRAALMSTIRGEDAVSTDSGDANSAGPTLDQEVAALTDVVGDDAPTLLLILDQFEEHFVYDPLGESLFDHEFPEILRRGHLRVNVLISLRDDALAGLDRYLDAIPELFETTLRIGPLTTDAARVAITEPIREFSRMGGGGPSSVDDELVERIIQEASIGGTLPPVDGTPIRPKSDPLVAAPQLQLVLERVWQEGCATNSQVLGLETLTSLGNSDNILREYTDTVMGGLDRKEASTAARMIRFLIAPSGGKVALASCDIALFANLELAQVSPVLQKLAEGDRLLRSLEPGASGAEIRYEIYHDILVDPLVAWQIKQENEQNRRLVRRAALVVLAALVGTIAAALALEWSLESTLILAGTLVGYTLLIAALPTWIAFRDTKKWRQSGRRSMGHQGRERATDHA